MKNSRLYLLSILFSLIFAFAACSSNEEAKPEPANPIPNGTEESMLRDAEQMYDEGLYSVARDYWSQFLEAYPNSEYAPFAELKIADSHFFSEEYTESIALYEEFIRQHPRHEAVAYAQIQVGNAYNDQYKGTVRDQAPLHNAIKNYNKVVTDYPKSEFANLAKRKVNLASEQLADYDAFVLKFYLKQGQTAAASNRIRKLLQTYPHTQVAKNLISNLNQEYPEETKLVLESMKTSELSQIARARLSPVKAAPIAEISEHDIMAPSDQRKTAESE